MVGRIARDDGPLLWARILLDIAQPILASDDIRQAIAQAETDADALREIIAAHAEELFIEGLFVRKIDWDLLPLSRRSRILAARVFIGLIAVAVLGRLLPGFPSWVLWLSLALLLICGGSAFLVFMLLRDSLVGKLKPIGRTRDELAREVIGPFIREQINRILDDQEHPAVMRVTSAPGLADLSDRERLLITETMHALGQSSKDMSSGSIGVSGPRGVGKTTLLKYLCDPSFEVATGNRDGSLTSQDLRLIVSAPVNYDAREFILHVFSRLCEEVLVSQPRRRSSQILLIGGRLVRRLLPILVALSVIFDLVILTLSLLRPSSYPSAWARAPVTALVGIVLALVLLSWWLWMIRTSRRLPETKRKLNDEARYWLTRVKYLQSFTSGSSGSMGMPTGFQIGMTATHQLSEIPMTLPELVDALRDFATRIIFQRRQHFRSWSDNIQQIYDERLARAKILETRASLVKWLAKSFERYRLLDNWYSLATSVSEVMWNDAVRIREGLEGLTQAPDLGPRIVIGIDEVDKIDADSARRFLNDIKAIFAIPNCLYLVSVSDEALEIYEQRILLGRTAFDSAFDEIIRVRPLNFDSCRRLLRRRIAGIPGSMIAFCQVISGGLPRDMIRTVRSVLDSSAHGQTAITEIAMDVITSEINALKRTCISDLGRANSQADRVGFSAAALKDGWPGRSSSTMIIALEKDVMNASLPLGFQVGLYFYVTVAEIFGYELPATVESLRHYRIADDSCIDQLAQARNTISVNPEVAWELITRFRAARGLHTLQEPRSLLST
jgi:hypothetical protein